jgi:hypothetical protein
LKRFRFGRTCMLLVALVAPTVLGADLVTVDPGKVHIRLTRVNGRSMDPAYSIDIYGDGRMDYDGTSFLRPIGREGAALPPQGKESYALPLAEVNRLVHSAVNKGLMSLAKVYRGNVLHCMSNTITLELDGQTQQIVDCAGHTVGMPAQVSEFEMEIDQVLEAAVRHRLSPAGLAQLAAQGFQFDTPAGMDLMERAVDANREAGDAVVLALFDRLNPSDMRGAQVARAENLQRNIVFYAAHQGRVRLLTLLISRGALSRDGEYEQARIDEAFAAAVLGGQPALVRMLWQLPDKAPHPTLLFEDTGEAPTTASVRVPLTLMLGKNPMRINVANDMEIAKFLVLKGCDPRAVAANKHTLLHTAAASNDVNFVRYVLTLGVDPSAADAHGFTALDHTNNEDVALALVAGGMLPASADKVRAIRQSAESMRWPRVLSWLKDQGR